MKSIGVDNSLTAIVEPESRPTLLDSRFYSSMFAPHRSKIEENA